MSTVNQIRNNFLNFFAKNDHKIIKSSSLVPHDDPTLMFTNSGMVQFKDIFTGKKNPEAPRATTAQKCVRAGGKHNDLDNVGYTARHHTFFEMLGNFSFGDYFKEQAIYLAWTFLTQELCLPKEKLYVTVYHTDEEAASLWKKIASLAEDRIIKINTNDNFWSMGDTGPCGPCSEIFYDHGEHIWGGLPGTKEQDGDRYIEIWNLVFMQFEQLANGEKNNLPKPSIDTGMGMERIAAVAQGVHDNFDIDLFKNIIQVSADLSGVKADGEHKVSHRVIADHLRSSSFLIADGVMPSNDGRGYVLRRIMRRAMRHVYNLGCKDALMYKLVPTLVANMAESYPELLRAEKLIVETLKLEEERFRETLARGIKLLDTETISLKQNDNLSGEVAFKLYDTFGFPLDLTKDILRGRNIGVDEEGFNISMQKQKEQARAAWAGSGEKSTESIWFELYNQYGATEFLGYELDKAQGKVLALVKAGNQVDEISEVGSEFQVITNQTPCYGESGGQMGDIGIIYSDKAKLKITDTKKYVGKLHVHFVKLVSGIIKENDEVTLEIDTENRNKLRSNHSATHLLHYVLRKQLGGHVTQKGSLVAADRFRFDFSHTKSLSYDDIKNIELEVNKLIRANNQVSTKLMTTEKAIESGAMALFGEKYDSEVRVVSMGDFNADNISVELCGGTHVRSTGDIALFKIISESAIAAGIRRIEAVTGEEALKLFYEDEKIVNDIIFSMKIIKSEVVNKVNQLAQDKKKLEKEIGNLKKDNFIRELEKKQIEEFNGKKLLTHNFKDVDPTILREIAESFKSKYQDLVILLTSQSEGKVSILSAVSSPLCDKYSAVDIVKKVASSLGGAGGGGKKDLAQAGASDMSKINDALEILKKDLVD